MTDPPPRVATLVLVDGDGGLLGALPPFRVATPWWQDVEPVVEAVRELHRLEVTILRLLETELPSPQGGGVTYLAEVGDSRPTTLEPRSGAVDDDPLRATWARPGGPDADLVWAEEALARVDLARAGAPIQVRSWNLSSLWRLPLDRKIAWLKVVPPFFAHEGRVLDRLGGGHFPVLLGHDGPRMLLAEIPGEDLYDATLPQLLEMIAILVGLQRAWATRVDELLEIGAPDWRAPALTETIRSVVDRNAGEIAAHDRTMLAAFVAGLPARFVEIGDCGLPDTLVHGDFHPGNVRGDASNLVLLDWGDCGVGHPLLDETAFLNSITPTSIEPVRQRWHALWREACPGSDPDRAARLLAPIGAARQAVIYQRFLDNIESSERAYHQADPANWLQRTARLVHERA